MLDVAAIDTYYARRRPCSACRYPCAPAVLALLGANGTGKTTVLRSILA
jgi:ABC-type branched-subunit amino acid transport system ATPase component